MRQACSALPFVLPSLRNIPAAIDSSINLIGRDGISKTAMWKKCAPPRKLRTCGNVSLSGHAGADPGLGLSFTIDHNRREV